MRKFTVKKYILNHVLGEVYKIKEREMDRVYNLVFRYSQSHRPLAPPVLGWEEGGKGGWLLYPVLCGSLEKASQFSSPVQHTRGSLKGHVFL